MVHNVQKAALFLRAARKAIALTGAGASTESGIPDFRSASGFWARYDPTEYATLDAFTRDPRKVWRMLAELEGMLDAKPNTGHMALAELERRGGLSGVITQNIDGLHQAAGNKHVVEYHGNGKTLICLRCGRFYEKGQAKGHPPTCNCGAILKPNVVLFGEQIPERAEADAAKLIKNADLLLVIGTSCEVWPASRIPDEIHNQGGKVIEINLEPAPHIGADLVVRGAFGVVMPEILLHYVGGLDDPLPS